jgi:hypothetical protein
VIKVRKGQALLLTLENYRDFRYSKDYLEVAEQIKYHKISTSVKNIIR